MKRLYIITGAAGHLGNTLIRILLKRGEEVRGLILPGEPAWMKETVRYVEGDIRKERQSSAAVFRYQAQGCDRYPHRRYCRYLG